MAEHDTLSPKRTKKFFFDLHNFDESEEVETIEEEEPPPPVFSEAELEQAKKDSYEQGKKDGLSEAAASREQFLAKLVQAIEKKFETLFQEEEGRTQRYEEEAIHLSHAIFQKLFPALNEEMGLEEAKLAIITILENQREHPEIVIEVHAEFADDIQVWLDSALRHFPTIGAYSVKGNATLEKADCRLSWKNGGAERNSAFLAEQIEKHLQETLADRGTLRNNEEDKKLPPEKEPVNGTQEDGPKKENKQTENGDLS